MDNRITSTWTLNS